MSQRFAAAWTGAEKPNRRLLIAGEGEGRCKIRHRAGNEAAVIPPVEANPWTTLPRLILQMRSLIELLVVIDAEHRATLSDRDAKTAHLRRKIACSHAGHHNERRQAVKVRHTCADREPGNFGIVPNNGKRDRRVAQHTEFECIVRVFGV